MRMLKQENRSMALKLHLSCIAPKGMEVAKEHKPEKTVLEIILHFKWLCLRNYYLIGKRNVGKQPQRNDLFHQRQREIHQNRSLD